MNEKYAQVVGNRRRVLSCHMGNLFGTFPPNSMEAIQSCLDDGAARVEIDVRFLSDDSMLVYHDATLDAGTDGFGAVEALTRDRVPRLRFVHDDRIRLAMLEDVVDAFRHTDAILQVDLKQSRPVSEARVEALVSVLAPLRERALIGSMAYWNVRQLANRGFSLAIDPTLQWHAMPNERAPMMPARRGLHGLFDDAPLAHLPGVQPRDYVSARIDDITALVPGCVEWMVDITTIEAFASLGIALGDELHERGVGLAAWTVRDEGPDLTAPLTWRLIELGASAIITDNARELAGYIAMRNETTPG